MQKLKTCPTCSATYGDNVAFCAQDGAALRSQTGLEPGTIIRKKYQIVSEIGRGGMAVVYRARHLIWNEDKALKIMLNTEEAGLPVKAFLAEAMIMRQFKHDHIVVVDDADYTEDDRPFVVMEYVEGESLRQRINRVGVLSVDEALRLMAQACSALHAAHERGIIHRDIKPQNLLLTPAPDGGDLLKVIDFGIAKVREDAGLGITGMLTGTTGYFVGTPEYASPEQAAGQRGNQLDGRTDIYSLGLVFYEMLTGELPFRADTPIAVLIQRLQTKPSPPHRSRPQLNIPEPVSLLVMKALETECVNRYGSANEMEKAIAKTIATLQEGRERQAREEAERLEQIRQQERLAREKAAREERERAEALRIAEERERMAREVEARVERAKAEAARQAELREREQIARENARREEGRAHEPTRELELKEQQLGADAARREQELIVREATERTEREQSEARRVSETRRRAPELLDRKEQARAEELRHANEFQEREFAETRKRLLIGVVIFLTLLLIIYLTKP